MTCSAEGCEKEASAARGYCWMHYQRLRRRGELSIRAFRENCDVPDCSRAHYANGLCLMHYNRTVYRAIERTPEALREYELAQAYEILNRWGELYPLTEAAIRTEKT